MPLCKFSDEIQYRVRGADTFRRSPQCIPVNGIEGFLKVNEGNIQWLVKLVVNFGQQSEGEDRVQCRSVLCEARLLRATCFGQ